MMSRLNAARIFAATAAVLALAVPIVGGMLVPGYSQVAHYISELGAFGMPHGAVVGLAGFLPVGLLVIGFLVSAAPFVPMGAISRFGYWMLLGIGVSYIGAAFFRCDAGCPAIRSNRQAIHNLRGLAGYGLGGIGLLLMAACGDKRPRWTQAVLRIAGVISIVALLLMGAPQFAPWRGLVQRVAEATLLGSLLFIAWRLAMTGSPSAKRDGLTPASFG